MDCAVCRNHPTTVGLLCEGCRDDVALPPGLLPQQILATIAKPTGDALVDQWGRAHPLESRTMIGRALDGTGIMILDASISRHHAHLARDTGGWRLRDLGSSNGTFHNEQQVTETTALAHGDRIEIGSVGFYLVCDIGEIPEVEIDPAVITTIRSLRRLDTDNPESSTEESLSGVPIFIEREQTDVGLPRLPMHISEPTGGGGGLLQLGAISVQLSANQTELLNLLARRMLDETHQPIQVRGFVRSSELLGTLSWDTRDPDENHIKQLIRRARRLLMRAGLGDLIESRQRFGYRLRLIPSGEPAARPAR
jgi:hypothetical protein